jgi:hypothetical protein
MPVATASVTTPSHDWLTTVLERCTHDLSQGTLDFNVLFDCRGMRSALTEPLPSGVLPKLQWWKP